MPVDLGVLRDEGAVALAVWRGQDVFVRYRPTAHTTAFQAGLEGADPLDVTERALHELVCGWDLTEHGQPLACTAATKAALPLSLKTAIVEGVLRDIVNPTTPASSPGGADPTPTSSAGGPPAVLSVAGTGRSASPSGSA